MVKRMAVIVLVLLMLGAALPLGAQSTPITLAVRAGFDGSFRENEWTPVFIQVSNDGPDIEGRLVIRPETSAGAVSSTFGSAISLPNGSRKSLTLYVTLSSFATEFRVELIGADGSVVAVESASVRALQPRDQLQIVISESASGTVDLTGVHDGGYAAFQANWRVDNLPDRAPALASVNRILFSDVDTGALTSAQRSALVDWVAGGGHLIVTGGTNWQGTAAGFAGLLPLQPAASITADHLTPLADWMRRSDDRLEAATVIATGALAPSAQVLVKDEANTPLLVRRAYGSGTVDYLAMDPNAIPLRGWRGLNDFWLALAASVQPRPSWSFGVTSWEAASDAVNVLPGVDLLPDILPLCGFLALYIGLIGPLNYVILNKINRREWAWMTIPLLIVLFSVMAWVLGFNLRGNEVTLSRLTVMEIWPDVDRARVGQFVGLLSPRRATYSFQVSDDTFLRPMVGINAQPAGLFGGNVQTNTTIDQTAGFEAAEFPVDASFIAGFNAETSLPRPDISGQAVLTYDDPSGMGQMRGSVRNDSPWVLNDPVILVRGQSVVLGEPLDPGDVATFEATLSGEGLPSPAPMAYAEGGFGSVFNRSFSAQRIAPTIRDLLQNQVPDRNTMYYQSIGATLQEQEAYRRRLFLTAFVDDPYNVVTGRGDQAYLAGWVDASPLAAELTGATSRTLDTLLVIAQFAVDVVKPVGEALISADRFTWVVQNRTGLGEVGPIDLSLQPGEEAVFRFTPLPEAVLRSVSELSVVLDRSQGVNRTLAFQLWNWQRAEWEDTRISDGNSVQIRQPDRFLGPQNAVLLRVLADAAGGYPRFDDLSIEQRGRF